MKVCSHCAEEWHRDPSDISVTRHFQDRRGTASYVVAFEQNPYPIWFPCQLKGYLCTKYRIKLSLSTQLIKQNLASNSSLFCKNGRVEFCGNYAVRAWMGKESLISQTNWTNSFELVTKTIRKRYVRAWFSFIFLFLLKTEKNHSSRKREEGSQAFTCTSDSTSNIKRNIWAVCCSYKVVGNASVDELSTTW